MSENQQDIGAEKGVLASLFDMPEYVISVAALIQPNDFAEPRNGKIYEAMLRLSNDNKSITALAVEHELRTHGDLAAVGGQDYITDLLRLDTVYAHSVDPIGYAEIVKDESARRALDSAARKIHELSQYQNGITLDEVMTKSEDLIRTVADKTIVSGAATLEEANTEFLAALQERMKTGGGIQGVPSGFIDLDKATTGWLPGQFIIVAARPAVGKALALDTPIPTPAGWKTMGEMQVGDEVFHPSGERTLVVATSGVMYDRPCYEVVFSDGEYMVADAQHEFPLLVGNWENAVPDVLTVEKMHAAHMAGRDMFVPIHNAVEYQNGNSWDETDAELIASQIVRATIEDEVWHEVRTSPLAFRAEVAEALISALALQPEIAFDTPALVRQRMQEIWGSVAHSFTREEDGTFSLSGQSRRIVSVIPVDSVPVQCIQVDHPEKLYLAGHNYVPTHNSTIAMDFARSAAFDAGKTVMSFNFEMSREEALQRIYSAESDIEHHKIKEGSLGKAEFNKLMEVVESTQHSNLILDHTPESTVAHIRAAAHRQKKSPQGLDLIIVDYLQLMSHPGAESRQQEVSAMSRGLKLLAKELEVPIIALSQLNRGPENRTDSRPKPSDLRESGSLEQDADIILMLHRPEVSDPNDQPGQAFLIIAKHRGGETFQMPIIPLLQYAKFANALGVFPTGMDMEPPPALPEEPDADFDNIPEESSPISTGGSEENTAW